MTDQDPNEIFGEEIIKKEEKVSEIMSLLMNLTSSSLNSTIQAIQKDNYYPKSEDEKTHFLLELLCAVRYRPLSIELFATMVKSIFEDESEHENISNMILSFLFRIDFQNSAHMCFLYHLYKIDFIKIESIFSAFMNFIESIGSNKEAPLIVYTWFAKEIETDEKSQNLSAAIQNNIQNLKQRNGLSESIEIFFNQYDEMKKNDWSLYDKYREDGYNNNHIYQLIKNDKVIEFQELCAKIDMNQMIPDSAFDRVLFLKDGARPIHIASYFGSIKVFKFLLLNNADLSLRDNASNNVTHFAVAGGNAEIIHILEHNEWDFHKAPNVATQFHRNEIYTYLFESKYFDNEKESNVIISASMSNNVEAIIHCAGELGMDANYVNKNNETALFQAVMSRSLDAVELLLHHKSININCLDNENSTLLHVASRRNFYEGMKILLELKNPTNNNFILDVNAVDKYGLTPLTIAAELGHSEIVKLILERPDLNPNYCIKNGTPLHLCLHNMNLNLLKIMLDSNKFDPNIKNQSSFTPLHVAAIKNMPDAISILCAHKNSITSNYDVDVNCLDVTGQSPLCMSIDSGDIDSVKTFLNSGRDFDFSHKNCENLTPLEIAERNGNQEIVNLLNDYIKKH